VIVEFRIAAGVPGEHEGRTVRVAQRRPTKQVTDRRLRAPAMVVLSASSNMTRNV